VFVSDGSVFTTSVAEKFDPDDRDAGLRQADHIASAMKHGTV